MSEHDYSNLREKNIAERNAIFAEFFQDVKTLTKELNKVKSKYSDSENVENEPPKKRRRTVSGAISDNTFRGNSVRLEFQRKYNTRSSSKNHSTDNLNKSKSKKPKLKILFPWAKSSQRYVDLMKMGVCDVDEESDQHDESSSSDNSDDDRGEYDVDDDDIYEVRRKRYKVTKAPYNPNNIPSVDEITEHMLANIAEKSTNKQYCKIRGTSCHQCRQKTLDTKTVCRSGECIGVRGQFCGPCLRGRYGESALEALKDPKWACPACRGLCNCSICRTRSGLAPTGILAPVAQEEGYTSVMDYLISNKNQ